MNCTRLCSLNYREVLFPCKTAIKRLKCCQSKQYSSLPVRFFPVIFVIRVTLIPTVLKTIALLYTCWKASNTLGIKIFTKKYSESFGIRNLVILPTPIHLTIAARRDWNSVRCSHALFLHDYSRWLLGGQRSGAWGRWEAKERKPADCIVIRVGWGQTCLLPPLSLTGPVACRSNQ